MTAQTMTAPPKTMPRLGRDWRLLWTASSVSVLGDGAFVAALPLLAARSTHDPRLISGLTVAGTLPWLVFSLHSGAIADRSEGRRLLIRAQGAQLVAVALVGVVGGLAIGGLWPLYFLAFALGIAATLAKSASQTLLPSVVPKELLVAANGRLVTSQSVAQQFLGPAVGSALFAAAPFLPFWADAATFAASMALVWRMPRTAVPDRPRRKLRSDVREGLSWLWGHRLLRTTSVLAAAANFGNFMGYSTLVLFVAPRHYGLLLSVTAIGGIAGGMASQPAVRRCGGRRVVRTTIIVTPLALIGVGLLGPNPVAVGVLTGIASACSAMWNVAAVSQRQRLVPAEMQGRVSAAGTTITFGCQPLGALAGGLVAGAFGLAAPWIVGGAIRLTAALLGMRALSSWTDEKAVVRRSRQAR